MLTGTPDWLAPAREPTAPAGTARPAAHAPVILQDEIRSRLDQKREESRAWDDRYRDMTVREYAQHLQAERRQEAAADEAFLAAMLERAATYRKVPDLAPLLAEAMTFEDHEAATAIFLEWHRRNPDEAFTQLAWRPEWLWFIEGRTFQHFEPAELIAEIADENRPHDFREGLAHLLGTHLGDSDDLANLKLAFEQTDGFRDYVLGNFMGAWIPDDGPAAARFIAQEFSPEERELFLRDLAYGTMHRPEFAWTDEFAAALFTHDLGVDPELQASLERQPARTDVQAGGYHIPSRSDLETATIAPGLAPDTAQTHLSRVLQSMLHHHRDYPELLAEGELTIEEVAGEMTAQIEGASAYPDELARALYTHLVPHAPEAVLGWAAARVSEDALGHETFEMLKELHEPRTTRLAELLETLPYAPLSGEVAEPYHRETQARFEEWHALDPDRAAEARTRLQDHPTLAATEPANQEDGQP